jgi:hypothetical protein
MADLQSVMGLLYRADWTQLSMSADVRFERDNEEWGGYHSGSAMLLIAPGGRYRLEHGDESTGHVEGSDGERGWTWWRPNLAPPPSLQVDVNRAPPLLELFRPSGLLSGFTLEVRGPVTACGRNAIAVTATRRTSVEDSPGLRGNSSDRLEVIVDAELGILLSRGHGRTWIVQTSPNSSKPTSARQPGPHTRRGRGSRVSAETRSSAEMSSSSTRISMHEPAYLHGLSTLPAIVVQFCPSFW